MAHVGTNSPRMWTAVKLQLTSNNLFNQEVEVRIHLLASHYAQMALHRPCRDHSPERGGADVRISPSSVDVTHRGGCSMESEMGYIMWGGWGKWRGRRTWMWLEAQISWVSGLLDHPPPTHMRSDSTLLRHRQRSVRLFLCTGSYKHWSLLQNIISFIGLFCKRDL